MSTLVKRKHHYFWATIICSLAAFFYLYEFILQVSPQVITNELMRDFGIKSAGLGLLAACYFYAYMPMQLPAGILYDRFGPRVLLTLMTMICALGALLFSNSDQLYIVALGRAMMGFGSSFAFIGTLVLVSRWFPSSFFPVITGIVQTLSSVGAIIGSAPLAAAVTQYGWQHAISVLSLVGFVLAVLIWLVVRDNPRKKTSAKHYTRYNNEWRRLKQVCKKRQTWIVGIYAFSMWAPIAVFAILWGAPYLREVYSISIVRASSFIIFVWVGIAVGSPLLGLFSQMLGRRCLLLTGMAVMGLITSMLFIVIPEKITYVQMYILMFLFGFSASGCILTFTLIKEINVPATVGTAIGLNNMFVVGGGALLQPLVGVLLELRWDGQIANSVPVYSLHAYQVGMTVIPLCYVVALLLSVFAIRESYCQQQVK